MTLVFIGCEDTRQAILLAGELWNDVIASIVPNLSETQNLVSPRPDEEWQAHHLELLRRCDALLAVDDDCTITVAAAEADKIPVFRTFKETLSFFREGL